jgi:hypothetical protein
MVEEVKDPSGCQTPSGLVQPGDKPCPEKNQSIGRSSDKENWFGIQEAHQLTTSVEHSTADR